MIGYIYRREGLQFTSRYDVVEHYFVSGNINFDLSRHYYYPAYLPTAQPVFSIATWGLGARLYRRLHQADAELLELDLG